jgi:hypothetical protein
MCAFGLGSSGCAFQPQMGSGRNFGAWKKAAYQLTNISVPVHGGFVLRTTQNERWSNVLQKAYLLFVITNELRGTVLVKNGPEGSSPLSPRAPHGALFWVEPSPYFSICLTIFATAKSRVHNRPRPPYITTRMTSANRREKLHLRLGGSNFVSFLLCVYVNHKSLQ